MTIGAIGVLIVGLLTLLAFNAENLPLIGGGTEYHAQFSEAAGLKPDDEVRVAGVKVGKVTDIALENDHVLVTFRVKDAWIGDRSEAAIKIKTVLGQKYLAVVPDGEAELDPDTSIPLSRTVAPFDVVEAFTGLSQTVGQIDTAQLAQSFEVLAQTFADTPANIAGSLDGLQRLSETIASRDEQLQELLAKTKDVTAVLADRSDEFVTLIQDGQALLTELQNRRDLIHQILVSTQELSDQLSGLVTDNQEQLAPMLKELSDVVDILDRNRTNISRSIALFAPFVRVFTNTLGNGRWFDSYLQNLVVPVPELTN